MALSEKLLGRDEHVIRHMHEHIKALFWNTCGLVLILIALVLALVFLPDSLRPWGTWACIVFALVAAFIVWFLPWLRWITSTYTITNRRIITRSGIFSKTGHDIPLSRISDVAYEHDLIDRIVGAGTLILETSAAQPLILHDVPRVEDVHVELTELLFSADTDEMDA
ncbi:PH domain-containing protein [Arcanobacterium phocisimile]|uniref:PH domain-containing protein n=1 Tax=Arcanobacterium phocisimile TaxID=1302235 RepID=A0ABX7II12_9ACTO|nr:PH domain-containing protein [Arcanobacterium phocisimile]QRV01493.1 PH domain-containing protein [Arcanobacterium phocisimile]